MIDRDLSSYAKLFGDYTELRMQENRSIGVAMVKGSLLQNSRSMGSGVSARVYQAGSWGFASHPELNEQAVESVISSATENALFMDRRAKKSKGGLPGAAIQKSHDFATSKKRLGQKELVAFVKEVDAHVERSYPGLSSRTVSLRCLDMEKSLLTSGGSTSYSMIPRANFIMLFSVDKDGTPVELYDVFGGLGQFEDLFSDPSDLHGRINEQYEHLMKKRDGVFADAGVKTCVLGADLAGILAHEALGHTTEADLVMGGSVAPEYLGKEAASPLITLVDFANSALGRTCPVPVYVDDEGTDARDMVIIDRGILKGYMHNKESARHFAAEPTGNARAFRFSDEPLIRMRNTAILPGESRLDDMLASIDDGYYLIKPSNGQADSTGEFMFGVPLGYEVKNGKIGRAIKDTTISGVAFEVLKSVSMVSDDMSWTNGGMCGKKQPIPVGLGGPAIKCELHIGGR